MSSISSSSASSTLSYLQQLYSNTTTTTTNTTSTESGSSSGLNASDMFAKLSEEVGGDGKTISKDDLEKYINTVKSDTTGKYDKGELGFLNQLDQNWDNISGGSDSITESDMASGMSYLQPPTSNSDSLSSDLFSSLLDALDSSSDSISLDDLTSYLENLTSNNSSDSASTSNTSTADTTTTSSDTTTSSTSSTTDTELTKEVNFIKDLIANFNDYTDNSGNISSSSLLTGMKQPQDPSTITSEQVTSPIDVRV